MKWPDKSHHHLAPSNIVNSLQASEEVLQQILVQWVWSSLYNQLNSFPGEGQVSTMRAKLVSFYFYFWVISVKKSTDGNLFAYFLWAPDIVCQAFRSLLQEKHLFLRKQTNKKTNSSSLTSGQNQVTCVCIWAYMRDSESLSLINFFRFLIINDKLWKTNNNNKPTSKQKATKPN